MMAFPPKLKPENALALIPLGKFIKTKPGAIISQNNPESPALLPEDNTDIQVYESDLLRF